MNPNPNSIAISKQLREQEKDYFMFSEDSTELWVEGKYSSGHDVPGYLDIDVKLSHKHTMPTLRRRGRRTPSPAQSPSITRRAEGPVWR